MIKMNQSSFKFESKNYDFILTSKCFVPAFRRREKFQSVLSISVNIYVIVYMHSLRQVTLVKTYFTWSFYIAKLLYDTNLSCILTNYLKLTVKIEENVNIVW